MGLEELVQFTHLDKAQVAREAGIMETGRRQLWPPSAMLLSYGAPQATVACRPLIHAAVYIMTRERQREEDKGRGREGEGDREEKVKKKTDREHESEYKLYGVQY